MILASIAIPAAIAGCVSCWSPIMPGWYLSLDLYFLEPFSTPASATRERPVDRPAKARRTIHIPGYAPALPVPAYWRARGSGWEVTP